MWDRSCLVCPIFLYIFEIGWSKMWDRTCLVCPIYLWDWLVQCVRSPMFSLFYISLRLAGPICEIADPPCMFSLFYISLDWLVYMWDRPCLASRSESLAWTLRIDPSLVHCHDQNRDGIGLSSADVHSLCTASQLILAKCYVCCFHFTLCRFDSSSKNDI